MIVRSYFGSFAARGHRSLALIGACWLFLLAPRADAQTFDTALLPSGSGSAAGFGAAVALSGSFAVVGAPYDDELGTTAGAAHVYEFDGMSWSHVQKLVASDATPSSELGGSVAIDGDVIVLGAPGEDSQAGDAGAVYVFERNGGTWSEAAKLLSSNGSAQDGFGRDVAIEGDMIAVGADRGEVDVFVPDIGVVHVFERPAGVWTETAVLAEAGGGFTGDLFGSAVDLDGGRIVVGSPQYSLFVYNRGAVYVFERASGVWTQRARMETTSSNPHDFRFGASVDLDGDVAVVGAPGGGAVDLPIAQGAAFVMRRMPGSIPALDTWIESELLIASELPFPLEFGVSVAIDGSTILVGARHEHTPGDYEGAVYVYEEIPGFGWIPTARLVASGGGFGAGLALDGGRALLGAPAADPFGTSPGAATIWDVANTCCPDFYGAPGYFQMHSQAPVPQNLRLDAGPAHAGELYLILGTTSGTGGGLLVPDAYFTFTLLQPNIGKPIAGALGFLDAQGSASAAICTPPQFENINLTGIVFHHAYVLLDPLTGALTHTSTPWPALLVR